MTLGGQTLPDVYSYVVTIDYRSGMQIMASGALVEDVLDSSKKRVWELGFHNVTAAQRSTLETAFAAIVGASATFVDLDAASYTVTRDQNQRGLAWSLSRTGLGLVYATSLTLREV
jgi:hypothetical protein